MASWASHLGLVANVLIANAVRHGRPPIEVELRKNGAFVLLVRDGGALPEPCPRGLGLQLVERIVQQGLDGSFTIERDAARSTCACVSFDASGACAS